MRKHNSQHGGSAVVGVFLYTEAYLHIIFDNDAELCLKFKIDNRRKLRYY